MIHWKPSIVAAILAFTSLFSGTAGAAGEALAKLTEGAEAFYNGKLSAATSRAREAMALAAKGGDWQLEVQAATRASEWCVRAQSTCGPEFHRASLEAIKRWPKETWSDPSFLRFYLYQLASHVRTSTWLRTDNLQKELTGALEDLISLPSGQMIPVGDQVRIFAELTIAESLLRSGNPIEARTRGEIAWANFLFTERIRPEEQLSLMARFIRLFAALKDQQRALRIGTIAFDYLLNHGRVSLYDAFDLLGAINDVKGLAGVAQVNQILTQVDLMGEIELSGFTRDFSSNHLIADAVVACSWNTVADCARLDAMVSRRLDALESRPATSLNTNEAGLVLAASWWDFHQGRKINPVAHRLLEAFIKHQPTGDAREKAILSGLAGFFVAPASDAGRQGLAGAARAVLHLVREELTADPLELPAVGQTRGVILALAAVVSNPGDLHPVLKEDERFQAIELLMRDNFNTDAQLIYAVSQSTDPGEAAALRVHHGFQRDWRRFEVHRLASRLDLIKQGTDAPAEGIAGVMGRYDDYIAALEQRARRKAGAQPSEMSLLAQVKRSLRPGERYITFFTYSGTVTNVCVSAEGAYLLTRQADLRGAWQSLLAVRDFLENPEPPHPELDLRFPLPHASTLSNLVLGPLQQCLAGATQLFMHFPSTFGGVPPQVLLDPWPVRNSSAADTSVPWLGGRFGLTRVHGAHHLIASRSLPPASVTASRLLGVGDPVFSGKGTGGADTTAVAMRGVRRGGQPLTSLPALPDTRVELNALAAALDLPSTLLLGSQATELAVRRLPLRSARVLSFATHGLVKEEIPGLREAGLAFTPGDGSKPFDDGVLTVSDIARLDLDADLVILSACNSAKFEVDLFAPEAASLSSAFFIAGARSTLATLWGVDSKITTDLITRFGRHLNTQGVSPAEAWRRVLAEYLSDPTIDPLSKSPRFWGAFVLFGAASDPLDLKPRLQAADASGLDLVPGHLGIGGAVELKDGSLAVSGALYREGADLATGTLNGFSPSGKRLWSVEEPGRGFYLPESAAESRELLAVVFAFDDQPAPLELRTYAAGGKLLKKLTVAINAAESVWGADLRNSQLTLLLGNLALGRVRLLTLNVHDGQVLGSTALRDLLPGEVITLRSNPTHLVLIRNGSRSLPEPWRYQTNRMGVRQVCHQEKFSEVVFLSPDAKSVARGFRQRHSSLTDYRWHDGQDLLFYEHHQPCGYRVVESGLLRFGPDSPEPQRTPFASLPLMPRALKFAAGSRLIFKGVVERSTREPSALDQNEAKFQLDQPDPVTKEVRFGLALGEVTASGAPKLRDLVFSGLDLFAETVIETKAGVLAFGSQADAQWVLPAAGTK